MSTTTSTEELDIYKALKEAADKQAEQVNYQPCPYCGYCPHCGRGNYRQPYPYYLQGPTCQTSQNC